MWQIEFCICFQSYTEKKEANIFSSVFCSVKKIVHLEWEKLKIHYGFRSYSSNSIFSLYAVKGIEILQLYLKPHVGRTQGA